MNNYEDFENNNIEDAQESYDPVSIYFDEISKYPLLSKEEEKRYINDLQTLSKIKLIKVVEIDTYKKIDIDLEQLLIELQGKDNIYEEVIKSLLPIYRSNENKEKQKVYNILKSYMKKAKTLNRTLNFEELSEIMEINPIKTSTMSEKKVLEDIKNFAIYKNAEDKLYCSNLRLVVSVAKRYGKGIELIDIIEDGNFGLLKAIERYDPSYDAKFSTYAVFWIIQNIERNKRNYRYGITLPFHVEEDLIKLKKIVDEMKQEMNRQPTIEEISERSNISIKRISQLYKIECGEVASLNKSVNILGEDRCELGDFIEDPNTNIEEDFELEQLKKDINIIFDELTEKQKEVIRLKYGFETGSPIRGAEVARMKNVSRENVRVIEEHAINRIRKKAETNEKIQQLRKYVKDK